MKSPSNRAMHREDLDASVESASGVLDHQNRSSDRKPFVKPSLTEMGDVVGVTAERTHVFS